MNEIERLKKKKALAPVISALILSSVVLVVGGAMWGFSQGAMTITSEDYAEAMINMSETISERFIIEHVAYIDSNLKVWVYNYGSIDIEVKIDVEYDMGDFTYPDDPKEWIPIMAGGFKPVEISTDPPLSGDLVIRAYTRRENNVYYSYTVPS